MSVDLEPCYEFEPWIAALADDAIEANDRERVLGHLAGCEPCRHVAARIDLLRDELVGIPEPFESSVVAADRAVAYRSPFVEARTQITEGRGRARGIVAALIPIERPAVWIAELAITAAAAALVTSVLVRRAEPVSMTAPTGDHQDARRGPVTASNTFQGAAPRPPEAGYLNVACTPACEVLDGGEMIGVTPLDHFAMRPGNHELTFRSRRKVRKLSVEVVAGKTLDFQFVDE